MRAGFRGDDAIERIGFMQSSRSIVVASLRAVETLNSRLDLGGSLELCPFFFCVPLVSGRSLMSAERTLNSGIVLLEKISSFERCTVSKSASYATCFPSHLWQGSVRK